MKKIYLAGLVVILFFALIYFLLPARQDMNKNITDTAARGDSSSSSPVGTEQERDSSRDITVEIPPEIQQTMGIRTATAAIAPMKKTIRTVGRVEYDERKLTTVNIKVEGWIEKLYADYTGKYVSKGAPLVDIYSPELVSTQLEYINLLNWKSSVGLRTQRNIEFDWGDRFGTVGKLTVYDLDPLIDVAKQKFALWEIPEEQMKEVEVSRKPIKIMTIKSPASGYVFQKPVFKGTRVAPGDKIFDIVDLSTVWVLADIYEYEIPFVKVGQNARIYFELLSGQRIFGQS